MCMAPSVVGEVLLEHVAWFVASKSKSRSD